MLVQSIKTRIFKESEDLFAFIKSHIKKVPENSVLVITSKIIALSEGRTKILKNKADKEKIIKAESEWAFKTKYTWLTIKDGTVMSSAGVDESNADGKLILLPKDSYQAAAKIRKQAQRFYKVKNLGVLITDSRLFPLRAGIIGLAVGYAGFKGIKDYRGRPDIFGRKLKMSQVDVSDSLATAAVLLMGESNECQPLALIKNAPVEFTAKKINPQELSIDLKEDLYQPLFEQIKKIKFPRKKIS